jgi:hypothetical protein
LVREDRDICLFVTGLRDEKLRALLRSPRVSKGFAHGDDRERSLTVGLPLDLSVFNERERRVIELSDALFFPFPVPLFPVSPVVERAGKDK